MDCLGVGQLESVCEDELTAILHCRRGRKEAFEAIVRKYMKQAYFIALGMVGNRDDALELSQEAFYKAYRHIDSLNPDGRFFPWFYQILRNLCLSHLRKRKSRPVGHLEEFHESKSDTDAHACFAPEVLAEKSETKTRVWEAIGRLDDKHREIIILRHFQNLSYNRIADVLFCSKGTVMSRLYYARKKLKEILETKKGGRQE